ncbi:hypothetical protein BU16DRAFT_545526 [Lophium mytilinum]|uniref:Uncharacterized protein n=1 Tax=Lophium mytilinum TaxID=390894 RepID=A0A6A6Q898_9PEZI|nr:hypothetical protein BU16DRAFT_545526 [Lophium mytilinum]
MARTDFLPVLHEPELPVRHEKTLADNRFLFLVNPGMILLLISILIAIIGATVAVFFCVRRRKIHKRVKDEERAKGYEHQSGFPTIPLKCLMRRKEKEVERCQLHLGCSIWTPWSFIRAKHGPTSSPYALETHGHLRNQGTNASHTAIPPFLFFKRLPCRPLLLSATIHHHISLHTPAISNTELLDSKRATVKLFPDTTMDIGIARDYPPESDNPEYYPPPPESSPPPVLSFPPPMASKPPLLPPPPISAQKSSWAAGHVVLLSAALAAPSAVLLVVACVSCGFGISVWVRHVKRQGRVRAQRRQREQTEGGNGIPSPVRMEELAAVPQAPRPLEEMLVMEQDPSEAEAGEEGSREQERPPSYREHRQSIS